VNALLLRLEAGDERVARGLSGWKPPRWVRIVLILASRLGDGWLWLLAGAALAAMRDLRALAAAAVAVSAVNAATVALKRSVRRGRPSEFTPNAFFQIGREQLYAFDRFSFPSGHSANAFGLAAVLSQAYPAFATLAFAMAATIAASRVALRLHYLTDVVAGVLLGLLLGGASWASLGR
jgi:undecaprenyl-diphosphatase